MISSYINQLRSTKGHQVCFEERNFYLLRVIERCLERNLHWGTSYSCSMSPWLPVRVALKVCIDTLRFEKAIWLMGMLIHQL